MVRRKTALILLFLLFLSVEQVESQVKEATDKEKKVRIIPIPALFYTPETRLGYGALATALFNLGDITNTRNSNIQGLAAYTLNDQIILQLSHTVFLDKEKYIFNGDLNYFDFPIFYYGIGNDTNEDFEEDLTYQVVEFRETILKRVQQHFFAGIQYRYTDLWDLEYNPEFLIEDSDLLNAGAGKNSGIGFSLVYDNRDNVLNATKGAFLNLSSFYHGKAIGSDFIYNRYTLDLRKYVRLNEKSVLAGQFFGEFNTSNTPFREMALLGGDMIMRGYYNGRYRDNQQMALQSEYRYQLNSWIGFTGFAAVGDVATDFGSFDFSAFKWSAGGGLRLMVNKEDRANVRIDYGIGNGTSGFYFAFTEAF